ncbi:mediator of RNA polymerase II transcription subunit 1 [Triplophysa dalaica]|uniref:mediator of RNA polymerase II transcription subunit 1 n=1 Tax=Triplophysa dalaica TaxID=1582913 RepID=UPI0024E0082D|nr:mediator of RNA polymerase II transcription subunit 1 [Triplophysa dalaica]XP_056593739.1 mediator of RNA polymerase II transcription subunit 1 [Triplophysa dalaica]XP_056593740.1 mediator of RNA polymerase II transcription subunit 1 [Triplophysa dalaica]XP_056593742.1 mediator of RNA polymerase II transcription subunit 1 [Triplophysa dalaica]
MKTQTFTPDLRSKYAAKSWNETIQLVRRCMDKTRTDGRVCEPIAKCLQKINEALNVSSLTAMVSRLEMIAKHKGLGSHLSPTETVCYLTADMFYIEVVLLLGGKVEDVRVAHHGEAPVSSPSFLQLLRMKKFQEFSMRLEDLVCFYNIPGESDVKIKIYTGLRHLENDLLKISHLPRSLRESDLHVDLILNGRIANVQPAQEGTPMKIEYYISRLDVLRGLSSTGEVSGGQVALVTVGSSDTSHRLQMESLISTPPQVDFYGFPLFQPLGETGSALLPATFLLKLQPPLPMLASLIEKMGKTTDVVVPEQHLQVEPLPQLLMKTGTLQNSKRTWTDDLQFDVPLPGSEYHSYVFSAAEWDHGSWKGALIHTVPFTHPSHVPALLDILRHQSAINVLLGSCFSNHKHHIGAGLPYDLTCEVLPELDYCLSFTFSLEDSDHLAVLFVMVADSRQLSCRLLMPYFVDHNLDDYVSRVLMRCMSIPITMRAIRRTVAIMKGHPSPDPSCGPVMESTSLTTPVCPDVSGPNIMPASHEADGKNGLPSSAGYYVMAVGSAQAANNANTDAVANPSPCRSLGVY